MKNTKVQTLGEQRMRGTASWAGLFVLVVSRYIVPRGESDTG